MSQTFIGDINDATNENNDGISGTEILDLVDYNETFVTSPI